MENNIYLGNVSLILRIFLCLGKKRYTTKVKIHKFSGGSISVTLRKRVISEFYGRMPGGRSLSQDLSRFRKIEFQKIRKAENEEMRKFLTAT